MSFLEMILSALRGITANKLRSGLTLLGVMIGVASVILLLAVGNGSAQTVNSAISHLGTNTLARAVAVVGRAARGRRSRSPPRSANRSRPRSSDMSRT
jgi:putative ABC transport system permease protein